MSLTDAVVSIAKQSAVWRTWCADRLTGLSHAYLLLCDDKPLVEALIAQYCCLVYCPSACGTCVECQKVLSGNKLDVSQPNPQDEILSVEQIKAVLDDAQMGAYEGGAKVYVIRAFDQQRERVQNAMLKTLEEPNRGVLFLLTANSVQGILPTVQSRVKTLTAGAVGVDRIADVLQQQGTPHARTLAQCSGGNIGMALQLAAHDSQYFDLVNDVTDMLSQLKSSAMVVNYIARPLFGKEQLSQTLTVMQTVIQDLLYYKSGLTQSIVYQHKLSVLAELATEFPLTAIPPIMDLIESAKQKVAANVTPINVADDLLLRLLEVKSKCIRS